MVEVNPTGFLGLYKAFLAQLPEWTQNFVTLFLLVILVVIYAVFIWKFYRFISKKNIIKLNLKQYNTSSHPFLTKLFEGGLSFIEYIIVLPFFILLWFAVFTLFLVFLTNNLEVKAILIISATIIAAIRLTTYIPRYGQELAKEIAKLLPFTLLAISITNPNFFSVERITTNLNLIPNFFGEILVYFLFITILEIILRLFDFIFSLLGVEDDPLSKEEDEEE
ncbi:MAG: hypothetical protein KKF48_03970 [Nanoarchaeota archaeon]|nr:hypothetical protein [Nanoarchaeota archaeon]MBU1028175.1 hypothetical protein [Nanoarchaeota archaeon]